MEGDSSDEFQDWELLSNTENTPFNPLDSPSKFQGIETDSDGIIRSDYFSIHNHNHNEGGFPNTTVSSPTKADLSDQGSVKFDNPGWIDPGSDTLYACNNPPDSSSDRSDDRLFNDFDTNGEFGFLEHVKNQVGSEQIPFGGVGNGSNSSVGSESERRYGQPAYENVAIANNEQLSSNAKSNAEQGQNRAVIWWKAPFELFKYCVFRVSSPVWTFSVAAAVVAFVILGRRLYKMKRKSQSLQLKVTIDDKKLSQFMGRAARLNEAFSVVRRVPIVRRPSLPAAGATTWPVMSLR